MLYKREIMVQGGSGGDGCISFRREKHIPLGGPDGGNGGDGGSIIIVANANLDDLSLLGRKREFMAENGRRGGGGRKRGKSGKDSVIPVPVDTIIFTRDESGQEILLADLRTSGQKALVARGGRGGLGNAHFATAVNQAPATASKGQSAETQCIILEVKPITDVCIVGPPSSGKSTLLSAISRAKPEVAHYPFTTRQPILGVMPDERKDLIVAEIPGIVEGSHLGKGLGNEFLRHVERTKLLIYLLDGSSPTVVDDFRTLDREIALYNGLGQKPKIVVVNKIDLPEAQARLPEVKQNLGKLGLPVFYISALKGRGVLELTQKAKEMVQQASRPSTQGVECWVRPKPRELKK